jgi:hypothetical protein
MEQLFSNFKNQQRKLLSIKISTKVRIRCIIRCIEFMIDSFGQTQSINIDESVDENDTGLKLRGQRPQIVVSKPRINKLE